MFWSFHHGALQESGVHLIIVLVFQLYSFAISLIVLLIKTTYSPWDKKRVFSFEKPGPLGFVLFVKCSVKREWSVLKPGKMSALQQYT